MKIVIAPDSYKESLSAPDVAKVIEKGFREIFPDARYVRVPLADGGEGTVEAMIAATQGKEYHARVTGPLNTKVDAVWGLSGDGHTAFIEMAAASGLALVPHDKRDPLLTTSYGTGELIAQALNHGAKSIIIGIGGSATNDAGVGMMQALGVRFLDSDGQELSPGGGSLNLLKRIDISSLDPRLAACTVRVACDVTNPLIGPHGASRIFGPQKGATEEMITTLDKNLEHYADVIARSFDIDVKHAPGTGAAGGMGATLKVFLNADLRRGIEVVTQALHLEEQIQDCTLVITGEGRLDSQSINGKVPIGVADIAKKYDKPVIVIAGSLHPDVDVVYQHGIDAIFSVLSAISTREEAFSGAPDNIYRTARNVAAMIKIGMLLDIAPPAHPTPLSAKSLESLPEN
ncbi:glycerate kinase [Klebsiella sp. BIGb0407]|nr:glycerate kinase [Klebsiella sp. BIGb0407]